MKTLNLFILTKSRELQLKALLDSFFKYSTKHVPLKVHILFDNNNKENHFHRGSFHRFKNEISHFNLIEVSYDNKPPVIENYFVNNEYNLVLPDNTIFTQKFDLTQLEHIKDDEILDLFKGLNRQKNSIDVAKSSFLSQVEHWKREGKLYSIEKEGIAFEQLPKHDNFKYYGKIFIPNNDVNFAERKIFFYPISPCFINGINKVCEQIDFYDVDTLKEYNPYGFSIRYVCGEQIDIDEMKDFSPNSLMYQYPYKFKKMKDTITLQDLVPAALYINLPHRTDRKEQIEKEIEKLQLPAIRIESVIPTEEEIEEKLNIFRKTGRDLYGRSLEAAKSRTSCVLSHLKAIQYAKDNNWKYALILEDDCEFLGSPLQNINAALAGLHRLPKFDILYLGANVVVPTKSLTINLAKLKAAWCTHAYILPEHMFDEFLNYDWSAHLAIDSYMMSLQSSKNCYIVAPFTATQRSSYSDIEEKDVNYSELFLYYFNTMLNKNDN